MKGETPKKYECGCEHRYISMLNEWLLTQCRAHVWMDHYSDNSYWWKDWLKN